MAEHKCYSESQTKRISSWAKNSCWERLAHKRVWRHILPAASSSPGEACATQEGLNCTVHLASAFWCFSHFPFLSSFQFFIIFPNTVFIFSKNPAKPHHSLTPKPVALSTLVAYTTSNNRFNKPRAQSSVMQYWISRHKHTSSLLTLYSLNIFFLRNATKEKI